MMASVFRVGEEVRIVDGPFINFVGVVRAVEMRAVETKMLTIGVGVKGREVIVKLEPYRLERIR